MFRFFLLAILLACLPGRANAQDWTACREVRGASGPVLGDCRPVDIPINPQGRELWLRATVRPPVAKGPQALQIEGVASSEAWVNGLALGRNGRPGTSAEAEVPGRYQAAFPIPDTAWQVGNNVLVVHMSSFHGDIRLSQPISSLRIGAYPSTTRPVAFAATFAAAGALFAAAFGFGVIFALRRTRSSLTLSAIGAVAGSQAILESLRALTPYAYPLHAWRLAGIWMLTATFAILLVSFMATRFWQRAHRAMIALSTAAIVCTWLIPSFDLKSMVALTIGIALSAVAAGIGVKDRLPLARLTLLYLTIFLLIGLIFPQGLLDLSYFLFAAVLLLPLLMAEVVRLGRDDQDRQLALEQAAARPNCLTVASSRGVELVPLAEIAAVVGADDYVELRLVGGRALLHAARLDRMQADLPASFLRVHRSVIANLAQVRGFDRVAARARLVLADGSTLPISRNRLPAVREALEALQRSPTVSSAARPTRSLAQPKV